MKIKYIIIVILLILVCGCQSDSEVSRTNIDIIELNVRRNVKKNKQVFKDDDQGKHDLLMLMANSVDYYNLVSGKMVLLSSYQDEQKSNEYIFQVNVPDYQSYIYQVGNDELEDQVIFRDKQNMYFFMGQLDSLNNDFNELINKQLMSVEEVQQDSGLYSYKELTLEQRIADLNISRVPNDLFGDTAPYLFPEDIALRQLGCNYQDYSIVANEQYLNRSVIKVEGKVWSEPNVQENKFSMLVDQETGIVLKYLRVSTDGQVEMKMESIAIDQGEEDLFSRYIKPDK